MDQADRARPVLVHGVVTNLSGWRNSFFIQDASGGISVDRVDATVVHAGDRVEIEGVTDAGLFAPIILAHRVRVLGREALPPAPLQTSISLAGGRQDAQRASVRGIVHSAEIAEVWGRPTLLLTVDLGPGTIDLRVRDFPALDPKTLVDAEVIAEGVCATNFNERRQFVSLRLFVNSLADVHVLHPASSDPFDIPTTPLSQLLRFTASRQSGHRIKVRGVVTYHIGPRMWLQDEGDTVFVGDVAADDAPVGSRVEAVGFVVPGDYSAVIESGIVRVLGHQPVPSPAAVDPASVIRKADETLSRAPFEGRLVTTRGTLIERVSGSTEDTLVMRSGATVFRARLVRPDGRRPTRPAVGAVLQLTGICSVRTDQSREPRTFELQLRTGSDVAVLQSPAWWTAEHALAAAEVASLLGLAALAWGTMLGRRVQAQTAVIRQQLEDLDAARSGLQDALGREQEFSRLDVLTGLRNRRAFDEHAALEVQRSRRYRHSLALAYIDCDNFKAVNDSMGHDAGDRVLAAVGAVIRQRLRATDLAARLGGDEFGILLPESGGEATRVALESLRVALNARMKQGGWPVSFSIGAVVCEPAPVNFAEMVQAADGLMYGVKRRGKDAVALETLAA